MRETDFPDGSPAVDQLLFLLGYAILAPSSHNTQPWKFRVSDDAIDIFADHARWLKVADSTRRELHISVGCALENLLIAAEHFGFEHKLDFFPRADDHELCATVSFISGRKPSGYRPPELFGAITRRGTFHGKFENRAIQPQTLSAMENLCVESGLRVLFTDDLDIKRKVDELVVRGDALQFADPEYRKELGYWLGQGVFGQSWLMAKIAQLAVTHVNMGKKIASKDSDLLMSAPILAAITSTQDDQISQIKAGMVFERIALLATTEGIAVHPMSQILELPELRSEVASLTPTPEAFVQHTFRMGHAEPGEEKSPRRPLREVLL